MYADCLIRGTVLIKVLEGLEIMYGREMVLEDNVSGVSGISGVSGATAPKNIKLNST